MSEDQHADVVHLSSVHPWTDNRIAYRECASLAEAGYRVALVAVQTDVPDSPRPVWVIEVPEERRAKRVIVSTVRVLTAALRTNARVFHLHDPELVWTVPVLRLLGRHVIYDAHEDLPAQVLNKPYATSRPLKVALKLTAFAVIAVARMSSHIIAATETIAARFPSRKTSIVHNYPPLREEEAHAKRVSDRAASVVYVGGISEGRGALTMIDAAGSGKFPNGWILSLAGRMSEDLKENLAGTPGWQHVQYKGQVPSDEARQIVLDARVGLLLFSDTAAHRAALPTKMFEYFAAGVPVIASDFPLWREIITSSDCGVVVDPNSPEQAAEALKRYAESPELLERHSRNARRLALSRFNWSSEAAALVAVYRKILREQTSAP
ncbi:glycosyltransferase family 4 protein [Sediminivirga luteola]|uniref:glycosyltransferase family 4 protein n=1 Tax=Sediminivirga luteola TaxID=1774748 RepID=UPI001F5ACD7A|nr:glycosyltransferase family 4 protein [Sediminivirga luteola]MCI2266956.1 glycosyltransferase family 4 protein [Sediminivirga luteola]